MFLCRVPEKLGLPTMHAGRHAYKARAFPPEVILLDFVTTVSTRTS